MQVDQVESWEQVSRLYILLKPVHSNEPHYDKRADDEESTNRLIIISKKKLPDLRMAEKYFGFVWKTGDDLNEMVEALESEEYDTITRGHRTIGSAR